ncbi:hypothetical protein Acid345_4652 [Candidatus Koribacter versatilis Ellin345]|uniref:Uncharacterized protein n=1 Tax=Koribacter versatilis (strain Ellin345) TaxID=204669 RepID=Q1IHJ8_KORVE|nr:DUF6580 family putative transport protein [Candidatus Koribacter versatilis]ABF43652.1 hypothetical protein Acid345_4652 [Candidatus Koribacter versatilis Ellin345]
MTDLLDAKSPAFNNASYDFEVNMLAILFVLLAIGSRFLVAMNPGHWWAFTPLVASLLFFGAKMPRKYIWAPVAALAVTDLLLSKFVYGYGFTADLLVSWAFYIACAWLGSAMLRENTNPSRLVVASLSSSVSFFILSNLAVWATYSMYPHNFTGLTDCFVKAIPFYRNQPVADLLFTAVFFSVPMMLESLRGHENKVAA